MIKKKKQEIVVVGFYMYVRAACVVGKQNEQRHIGPGMDWGIPAGRDGIGRGIDPQKIPAGRGR